MSARYRVVAGLALVGAGAAAGATLWHRDPGTLGTVSVHDPTAEQRRVPRLAPVVPVAQVPSAPPPDACGREFLPSAGGLCRPINPATGAAYSEEELRLFGEMRASPFIANGNLFVPKELTPAEAQGRRQEQERMNRLADAINNRAATAAEIDEYFRFREMLTSHRMQILTFEHARRGGKISRHDPNLDLDDITDPKLAARFLALDAELKADFDRRARARQAHGLAANNP